jgi:hypothetical protein
MEKQILESLLESDEGPTLDFKKQQYPFSGASEEEKSELLKDIIGFCNTQRRTAAYVLIGVEESRGSRCNVIGVEEHLPDHSLQQFVNNLTNRPIRFQYEVMAFEGRQVGIIKIETQQRPVYLRRDYGKLRKEQVYIRRGSSTDPTKPATIEEIAQMRVDDARPPVKLSILRDANGYQAATNYCEERIDYSFVVTEVKVGCHPNATGSSSSRIQLYIRSGESGEKMMILNDLAVLPSGESLIDASHLLVDQPLGMALDFIGVDLYGAGSGVDGLFASLILGGR